MKIVNYTGDLQSLRQKIYGSFEHRPDALMEVLDALTSNPNARSVAELSLSPHFHRQYSSVFDAIDNYLFADDADQLTIARRVREALLINITASVLPARPSRVWYFATDATSVSRQYATTLEDKTYVYQPNSVAGNKPVTIGHQYCTMAYLPEKGAGDPPWVVPMLIRRIRSCETETEVAVQALAFLFSDEALPWIVSGELVVNVADSKYGTVPFLFPLSSHPNLLNITRIRANRVLYRLPEPVDPTERKRGRPRRYGKRFDLKDGNTWDTPDEQEEFEYCSKKGHHYKVVIEAWNDLIMRGKKDMPMHKNPFRLLRVLIFKPNGDLLFTRPMWLIVIGERRNELSLKEIWQAYRQRYDIEHFFRFGKQHLLMADFQTNQVERSENWMALVQLAYVQLFMARKLASSLPRRWERYLPVKNKEVANPTQTQRDFSRIIDEIGTPAKASIRRGKSVGRKKGSTWKKKPRKPAIKKGKKGKKGQKSKKAADPAA